MYVTLLSFLTCIYLHEKKSGTWTARFLYIMLLLLPMLLYYSYYYCCVWQLRLFFFIRVYMWLRERDWWWCSEKKEKPRFFFSLLFFILSRCLSLSPPLFRSYLIDAIFDDDVLSLFSFSCRWDSICSLKKPILNELWFDEDRKRKNETR